MTEQKDMSESFIYEALGNTSKPGLAETVGQRLQEEIGAGTTQIIILVGQDVWFGKPHFAGKRQKPRYAEKGDK